MKRTFAMAMRKNRSWPVVTYRQYVCARCRQYHFPLPLDRNAKCPLCSGAWGKSLAETVWAHEIARNREVRGMALEAKPWVAETNHPARRTVKTALLFLSLTIAALAVRVSATPLDDATARGDMHALRSELAKRPAHDTLANALAQAAIHVQTEAAKALLANGADANVATGWGSALALACDTSNTKSMAIVKMLLAAGASPDGARRDGEALQHAAQAGNVDAITALLMAGANPLLMGTGGKIPLSQVATQAQHPEAARILASAEARAQASQPPVGGVAK